MVRKDESIEKTYIYKYIYIYIYYFLENHYVSKDEISKQHLNVIKKSNFVRSSHPPLETILITCQKK